MYKGTSQSLQRKHRVVDVRKPVSSYVNDDDIITTAGNMTMDQCKAERSSLLLERTRSENELAGAKRAGRWADQKAIGHRLQAIGLRLSLVNDRVKQLNQQRSHDTLYDAAVEVLPPDLLRKVLDRANEIRQQQA